MLTSIRWHKLASRELPTPAAHVTVSAPYIFASTQEHSFIAFELRAEANSDLLEYTIEPVLSDSQMRETWHHLTLTLPPLKQERPHVFVPNENTASAADGLSPQHPNVFLVADRACSLTGIYRLPYRPQQNAAPVLFEASLPRSIVRLRQGHVRPPWCRIDNLPGIIHQSDGDILGCAADGTLMSFLLLDTKAWRLLKAFENIARIGWYTDNNGLHGISNDADTFRQSSDLCPERNKAALKRKTGYHVNGDLLEQQVDDLLRLIDDLEEREEREGELRGELSALAMDLLGEDEEGEDALEKAIRWVKQVLKPLL